MRRWIIAAASFLALLLFVVPVGLIYYATHTEHGLQLIVRMLPVRMGPVELRIVGMTGTAVGGFKVESVDIVHEHVHLHFDGVEGRITLAPLLLQTLHSPDVRIAHALIDVHHEKHPTPPSNWHFLPYWMQIRADALHVGSATLIVPNGTQLDAQEIEGSGVLRSRVIRIFESSLNYGAARIAAHGTLRSGEPMGLDADARLSVPAAGRQPPWVLEAIGKGDLSKLALTGHFTQPFRADFNGLMMHLTANWQLQGDSRVEDVDIRAWGGGGALGRISGQLALTASGGGFTARGPLSAAGLGASPFATVIDGHYSARVLTAEHLELTHSASGAHLTGKGSVTFVSPGPRLTLSAEWRGFRWPLEARTPVIRSDSGRFALQGLLPYDLTLSGDLQVGDLPVIGMEARGALGSQLLTVDEAVLNTLEGTAAVAGELRWAPKASWSATGTTTRINPGLIRRELPGHVSFGFTASGAGLSAASDFAVQLRNLNGQLRNLPVRGSGSIARRGPAWQFSDIDAQVAGASLTLDGTVADRVTLRFNVKAPDLSAFTDSIGGHLTSSGYIVGTLNDPTINAVASGAELRYAGVAVQSLEAKIDVEPHGSGAARADVRARGVSVGEHKLDQLAFTLDGTMPEHRARLTAASKDANLELAAMGGFANGQWSAQVDTLNLSNGQSLQLHLESPAQVAISSDAVHASQLCLSGMPARTCAQLDWTAQKWAGSVFATAVPLQPLTTGLTRDVEYRGTLDLNAQASGRAGAPLIGVATVKLADAQIIHKLASGHLATTKLGSGALALVATPEAWTGDLSVDADTVGFVKGHLVAERSTDDWRDMPLAGKISLQTGALELVSLYVPQVDRAAGQVRADVTVAGTVGTPRLSGELSVKDGELDVYQVNLAMRATALQARFMDNGLDFNAEAHLGNGTVSTQGHLEWRAGLPYGRFHLSGENLRVADIPEAQVEASPDLDFTADGHTINVAGTVNVPFARIVPTDLTNAVRTSPDEVIVGEESTANAARFNVVTNVTLSLGDRVNIETSGLKARLTGSLAVRSGEEEITRGNGELKIVDGQYAAYGRRLDIEHGRLIFTASPVDNPGIDIRAVKRFDDPNLGETIAGVNVRGTLRQPRMTFFSEPPLPPQQVISLILAGGSFGGQPQGGGTSTTTSTNRNGANAELLGQGAAILGQELSSRYGLPDLGVGVESDLNNDTSLVLGKYLSPRLYVSYGISLTQSLSTVKVRYTLGDHWAVRTEFGQVGGADIVYTIDK